MKPFIELNHLKQQKAIYKKYGFRITNLLCSEHENGLISVSVGWAAKKDNHLFKYIKEYCHHYSSDGEVSYELEFQDPALSIIWTGFEIFPSLRIGIKPESKKESLSKIPWDCLSFQDMKFGAVLVFAKSDWTLKANTTFDADASFLSNVNRKLKN